MIGCDIDGVLSIGFRPETEDYVLISGRTVEAWKATIDEFGSSRPIFLRPLGVPGDRIAAAKWKSVVIAGIGVTTYFEDDPVQADIIRNSCPKCQVVLIEGIK